MYLIIGCIVGIITFISGIANLREREGGKFNGIGAMIMSGSYCLLVSVVVGLLWPIVLCILIFFGLVLVLVKYVAIPIIDRIDQWVFSNK